MRAEVFMLFIIILVVDLFSHAHVFGQIIDRNADDYIPQKYSGPTCPFECSCIREVVRCASQNLTYLPDFLDLGPYTTSLDARNNRITRVGPKTFHLLVNLTNMQLNDNLLTEVESYTFVKMIRLKYLYLHRNQISTIRPRAFYGLRNLQLLYLNHNQIKTIDHRSFFSLLSLKELSFQSNHIETLPRELLQHSPTLYLIKIRDNPIVCDCRLRWLLHKINVDIAKESPFITDLICHSPDYLKDIPILKMRDGGYELNSLKCRQDSQIQRERPSSPQFMEEPEDKIVSIGNSVELNCEAKGDPLPHIKWMKNNHLMSHLPKGTRASAGIERIYIKSEIHTRSTPASEKYLGINSHMEVISIWPVLPEDEGYYQCVASNPMGRARSKRAKISVMTIPATLTTARPERKDSLEHVDSSYSMPLLVKEVKCGDLKGHPRLTKIKWSKSGIFLGQDPDTTKYWVDEVRMNLVIKNFSARDEGVYTCHVEDYSRNSGYPDRYRYQSFVTANFAGRSENMKRTETELNRVTQTPHNPIQWPFKNYSSTAYRSTPSPIQVLDTSVVYTESYISNPPSDLRILLKDPNITKTKKSNPRDSMYFSAMASTNQNVTANEKNSIKNYFYVTDVGKSLTLDCEVMEQYLNKTYNNHSMYRTLADDESKIDKYNGIKDIVWTKDGIDVPTTIYEGAESRNTDLGDDNYLLFLNGSLKILEIRSGDGGLYACQIYVNGVGGHGRDLTSKPITIELSSSNGIGSGHGSILSFPIERLNSADQGHILAVESVSRATKEVDAAILKSISSLKKHGIQGNFKEMMAYLSYPSGEAFQVARAGDIFHRAFQIIEDHIEKSGKFNVKTFEESSFKLGILSPTHIELIANMSGCRPTWSQKSLLAGDNLPNDTKKVIDNSNPCSRDMCFHMRYRTADGSCNNLFNPDYGSALMPFHRLLPARYENGLNTPLGWNNVPHDLNLSHILFPNSLESISSKTSSTSLNLSGIVLPNPRLVSRLLATTQQIELNENFTMMLMQWGQFLDHDLDFAVPALSYNSFVDVAPCGEHCFNSQPCYPIKPMNSDPRIEKQKCIEFVRSSAVCGTGSSSYLTEQLSPREQINSITSFIDGSNVYGSTEALASDLRDHVVNNGGRLRVGPASTYVPRGHVTQDSGHRNYLPFGTGPGMDCKRGRGFSANTRVPCFQAGDHRANEQLALLATHTLWVRQHNRLVRALKTLNPHWDGDRLYQEGRKIVGAQMQVITYKEWLPKIIGSVGMDRLTKVGDPPNKGRHYAGYDSTIQPGIANVFATAVLRFGHSLVNPVLFRLNTTFQPLSEYGGHLALHEAFFVPAKLIEEGGIDPLLRGLFGSASKKVTSRKLITAELTEKLFEHHHRPAFDLIAINLQRGRDHGLPSYGAWREWCGMPLGTFEVPPLNELREDVGIPHPRVNRITAFHKALGGLDVFNNLEAVSKLSDLYLRPQDIEIWIGGMLENPLPGAILGPTFTCLLIDQFRRLRDGDRFWYQNYGVFTSSQLAQIEKSSLASVLCDNGDSIDRVQPDVFLHVNATYKYIDCKYISKVDLTPWVECPYNLDQNPSGSIFTKNKDLLGCAASNSDRLTCTKKTGSTKKFGGGYDSKEEFANALGLDSDASVTNDGVMRKVSSASMYFVEDGTNKIIATSPTTEEDVLTNNAVDDMRSRIDQMKAEMELLHDTMAKVEKQMLQQKLIACKDVKFGERLEGETWDDGPCRSCKCYHGQITCYSIQCPDIQACPIPSRFKTDEQCCTSCITPPRNVG